MRSGRRKPAWRGAVPAASLVWLLAALAVSIDAQRRDDAQSLFERAVSDFLAGRVSESVTGFDRLYALAPAAAPRLWQRGIALYYVGRYRDCRAQFELHRTVNPNDVENAVWHFLCVARAESPERARAALLPVGADPRVPMREIYGMFAGRISPESVLVAAGDDPSARFYAALYVGLYHEAHGVGRARFYIVDAADERFASVGGYMNDVARIHMQVRGWSK
jgi:lipoprotein NlpI